MEINEQLVKDIKKINQRYKDIVQTLGYGSELERTYRKYLDKITTTDLTESGYLAIKTPKKLIEKDLKAIKTLLSIQTQGQYKESKKNLYKSLFDKAPTKQELKEFIEDLEDVHEFVDENATFIYNVSEDLTKALHRSNNLTADEFKKMQDLIKIARETNFDVVETIKRLNQEMAEIYD